MKCRGIWIIRHSQFRLNLLFSSTVRNVKNGKKKTKRDFGGKRNGKLVCLLVVSQKLNKQTLNKIYWMKENRKENVGDNRRYRFFYLIQKSALSWKEVAVKSCCFCSLERGRRKTKNYSEKLGEFVQWALLTGIGFREKKNFQQSTLGAFHHF